MRSDFEEGAVPLYRNIDPDILRMHQDVYNELATADDLEVEIQRHLVLHADLSVSTRALLESAVHVLDVEMHRHLALHADLSASTRDLLEHPVVHVLGHKHGGDLIAIRHKEAAKAAAAARTIYMSPSGHSRHGISRALGRARDTPCLLWHLFSRARDTPCLLWLRVVLEKLRIVENYVCSSCWVCSSWTMTRVSCCC